MVEIDYRTLDFIEKNAHEDVCQLALRSKGRSNVDLSFALDQISGRQVVGRKVPSWAAINGIIYPPHLSLEQCSSEPTARYKAKIVSRDDVNVGRARYVDLTGGFGVDFSYMSHDFQDRVYVERNAYLCELAKHNMPLLGINATVINAEAEDYLLQMGPADVVFLDPARRDSHGGRTYALSDCTPNVLQLLPLLRQKSQRTILKLSPMLDWRKAVDDIRKAVIAAHHPSPSIDVHIISVRNECKELVVVIGAGVESVGRLVCVNVRSEQSSSSSKAEVMEEDVFEVELSVNANTVGFRSYSEQYSPFVLSVQDCCTDGTAPLYLYEPNASVMKGGCFAALCERFGVNAVAPNSHLFVADRVVESFPGRRFRIEGASTMNKKEVRRLLSGVERANVSVRNFPLSSDELRRRLRLRDGGDDFLFATTMHDGAHVLLLTKKV